MTDNTASNPRPPFRASDYANDNTHHLLIACSGSVATIKLGLILNALSRHRNLTIRVILTKSACYFIEGPDPPPNTTNNANSQSTETEPPEEKDEIDMFSELFPNCARLHRDEEEWSQEWERSSPILHIELRRWAHLLVIAPLSANTLAKIVNGISDNLLCNVVRAWDTTGEIDGLTPINGWRKRIIVAPAMNTAMWRHPITKKQIGVLEGEWGVRSEDMRENGEGWFEVLRPVEKELACGDVGDGAMREWKEIVGIIEDRLGLGRRGLDRRVGMWEMGL